jgi:hypothetical protein
MEIAELILYVFAIGHRLGLVANIVQVLYIKIWQEILLFEANIWNCILECAITGSATLHANDMRRMGRDPLSMVDQYMSP